MLSYLNFGYINFNSIQTVIFIREKSIKLIQIKRIFTELALIDRNNNTLSLHRILTHQSDYPKLMDLLTGFSTICPIAPFALFPTTVVLSMINTSSI